MTITIPVEPLWLSIAGGIVLYLLLGAVTVTILGRYVDFFQEENAEILGVQSLIWPVFAALALFVGICWLLGQPARWLSRRRK